jgi:hypothetical protein
MSEWASESPSIGFLRLLKDGRRYVVPPHQRDYSWSADEIDRFFADIEQSLSEGADEYFLGLMVFKPEGKDRLVILDGQQRLGTAILILAAIREWLRSRGLQTDADQINSEYIARRELGGSALEARLILNRLNNPSFERYIVAELPDEEIDADLKNLRPHDPNRKLLEATLHCRQRIRDLAAKVPKEKASESLFSFARFLEGNVKVVRLIVPNEANAYTVFETLNDRGLDLTALDLVKNYIFGRAEGKTVLSGLQDQWLQMMGNLTNVRADDFLKAWWTSRHGRVQTAQLFPRFKDSVRSVTEVGKTASDMLLASEQYAALEVADDPLWGEFSESARNHIRALKVLGGAQTHPVLLAALTKWDRPEVERLLRLLETVIVRYQLIGGGRTGRLEIGCAVLAAAIYSGKVTNTRRAADSISDLLPSDKEFRSKFELAEEKGAAKARLLLIRLESQARAVTGKADLGGELEPRATLTVEHVLPKTPGSAWMTVLSKNPDFAEDYTHRLGNLCLLTQVNRRIGNAAFTEKQKVYAKSELLLTNEIARATEWTANDVEERQKRLAKLAVAVWRFN